MATHFSILAWETPGTEEPGGLQSMGSQESDMTEQLNSNNCIKKELMKCRDKRVDRIKDHQLEKARLSWFFHHKSQIFKLFQSANGLLLHLIKINW